MPGWQPSIEPADNPLPPFTRPLWLRGAWTATLDLESDEDGVAAWAENIRHRDDTDLATAVLGALLESVERGRSGRPTGEETRTLPSDPAFHAR